MRNWRVATCLIVVALTTSGCTSLLVSLWEDTVTAIRYATGKGRDLLGGHMANHGLSDREFFGEFEKDFIPLSDQDAYTQTIEHMAPQARDVPGAPDGRIPGIEAFHNPTKELQSIFAKIYFDTDQHVPKSKEYYQALNRAASYLKKHPETYVFIAGHCDERASEAYNLALGTRRSNFIRNYLIKNGVNPNQLFTISYGKEKPDVVGHNPKSWAKNRRVAFKIYEKRVTL